jgi:hypothetical protein
VTDPWDERTEQIPGVKKDRSIELDLDTDLVRAPLAPMAFLEEPRLLVFEPAPLGVASAFAQLGYAVKTHATPVDVMDAVARDTPSLVVCAPSPEPERRRMLAAALRIRFPSVPIIYVSRYASQEDAVLGAIREGARAVVAWPLPSAADVKRVLAPYLQPAHAPPPPNVPQQRTPNIASSERTDGDVDTAPISRETRRSALADAPTSPQKRKRDVQPASDEDASFDELATAVVPQLVSVPPKPPRASLPPRTTPNLPVEELPSDAMRPLPLPLPVPLPPSTHALIANAPASEPPTAPSRRAQRPPHHRGAAQHRGEIGELLDALSPFWWSLDDASQYLRERSERGDVDATTHARTLQTVLKILDQVRDRVDESGA